MNAFAARLLKQLKYHLRGTGQSCKSQTTAFYYSLIARSMDLIYAYISTTAFALCEGKSASK